MPLSMTKFCPVTKPEASETRYADELGDVLVAADAADGVLRVVFPAHRLVRDPAGAHAVHADLRAEAERKRLGEPDEAGFRRRVSFVVRLRLQRTRRGDVDDGAARAAQGARRASP